MIAIIAACAENGVIGNRGRIPWKVKGEQIRFRTLTMGNVVVLGRRSFEEIGKPLPGRDIIVVSNTKRFQDKNLITAHSLSEAVFMAGNRDIYISGGAMLYREALTIADRIYLTEIHAAFPGDTYFPVFDKEMFIKTVDARVGGEIPYDYVTYQKTDISGREGRYLSGESFPESQDKPFPEILPAGSYPPGKDQAP